MSTYPKRVLLMLEEWPESIKLYNLSVTRTEWRMLCKAHLKYLNLSDDKAVCAAIANIMAACAPKSQKADYVDPFYGPENAEWCAKNWQELEIPHVKPVKISSAYIVRTGIFL